MANELSLWSYIVDAGVVVKCVMMILLMASVASWTIICERWSLLRQRRRDNRQFMQRFWSGSNLNELYDELDKRHDTLCGLSKQFYAGFTEYTKLYDQAPTETILSAVQRAMYIAQTNETDYLEKNLSFLATVGSTSPYIGLFGTVWGIMTAFQALGRVSQASIASVAPGISEALIATAIGLFAAIPAVIAYNRLRQDIESLNQRFDTFQQQLIQILQQKDYDVT